MKNMLWLFAAFCVINSSCSSSKKSGAKEIETVTNVSHVATELGGVLASALNLNNSQKTSLTGSLSTYLTSINNLPESVSKSKLNEIKSVALSNIRHMLTESQYKQLIQLGGRKKSGASISDALKSSDLSTEAATALAELLTE